MNPIEPTRVNKTPWILGGVAVALIAAGTIYGMQANSPTVDTSTSAAAAIHFLSLSFMLHPYKDRLTNLAPTQTSIRVRLQL